jgi:hypothetical protein
MDIHHACGNIFTSLPTRRPKHLSGQLFPMKEAPLKTLLFSALALLLLALPSSPVLAAVAQEGGTRLVGESPHYLNLAVGSFEAFDDRDDAVAGQLEFRFGQKLFYLGPLVGVLANGDGGVIGYAGIYLDLALGDFILSPQTGVGAYDKGSSKDLGGTFEFISGLGLSYQFADRSRLGIRYEHISNGNLHDKNPGADILLLSYGIAF